MHDDKLYEFKSDNIGGWHDYSIKGNKAPATVLKEFFKNGTISRALYKRLLKVK